MREDGVMISIRSSEITPEHMYLSRRKFMQAGMAALGSLALAACSTGVTSQQSPQTPESHNANSMPSSSVTVPPETPAPPAATPSAQPQAGKDTDELGEKLTSYDDISHYNNYFEFTAVKQDVAAASENLKLSPWTVQVGGLVNKPKTYGIDDLLHKFPPQERIYRLRCVEGWSMVIPWLGFPLTQLLKEVEPLSKARFVRFETLYAPDQMPGQNDKLYPWPYVEGLQLSEAMHDLTLMTTGMYGKPLLPQDGAPIRLAVPWKYGFKSGKSIVKIDLVADMPVTFWVKANPAEYGFYGNVNPNVRHPRWSQATERRIGELSRRKTLMFNGYADQVAHLYDGMDLTQYY
jgi:sulfoxide reductase catalytic subunit YedY